MVPTTAEAFSASYDPFSPETLENPYPYYAALRSLAPCCYLEKYDVYFVSRYRDVVSALKNWQTFSSSEGGGYWRARNYLEGGDLEHRSPGTYAYSSDLIIDKCSMRATLNERDNECRQRRTTLWQENTLFLI